MPKVPLDLLYERLASFDPIYVCELLHLTSEDLCDAFKSRIKKYQESLSSELDVDLEQAFNPDQDDDRTFDNYDKDNYQDFMVNEPNDDGDNS